METAPIDIDSLSGRVTRRVRKKPRPVDEGERVCAHTGCDTVLNRYNRFENCYRHQERRIKGVRGRPLKKRGPGRQRRSDQ